MPGNFDRLGISRCAGVGRIYSRGGNVFSRLGGYGVAGLCCWVPGSDNCEGNLNVYSNATAGIE